MRPRNAPLISWETWLFALARWPFVIWGLLGAVRQKLRPRPVTFKVTPKKTGGPRPLPVILTTPFAAISLPLAAVALYGELNSPAVGYVFLCIAAAAAYAAVALAVPVLHVREAARASGTAFPEAAATARLPLALGLVCAIPVITSIVFYPAYAAAVLGW
ncbi:hypothetical protein [Streptomyces sp. NPDC006785]